MKSVSLLFSQLVTMFIYLAVGYVLRKTKLVSDSSSKALSNYLLYVILPCVILRSFIQADISMASELAISLGLSAAVLGLAMLVSFLCFRRAPEANFGSAFSNAGFMGIPLITSILGKEAVFYITGMVALLNILQWTYGQAVLTGSLREFRPGSFIKNPLVLSFAVGLVFFFIPGSLPVVITNTIDAFAACNAPVAMVILGVLLGNVPFSRLWRSLRAWCVSGVRLLLIPALSAVLLAIFPSVPADMKTAILIAASAPVGSNLAVYVQKQGGNSDEAVTMVCLSTLLSAATMPLMLYLSTFLW